MDIKLIFILVDLKFCWCCDIVFVIEFILVCMLKDNKVIYECNIKIKCIVVCLDNGF